MSLSTEYGYYKTNIGVLYYEGVFLLPVEFGGWEPVDQDSITHYEYIDCSKCDIKKCYWVRTRSGSYQLQAPLWWVASISKSEKYDGLFFYRYLSCGGAIDGYSDSETSAVNIIELLVSTHSKYNYSVQKFNK